MHDQVCFFSQQTSEKYLKALSEELGGTIPKTHDLEKLLGQLLPHYAMLRSFRRGLRLLTEFAVAMRYPGANATKRQAVAGLRWATRIRQACRTLLGIKPSKGKMP